jgi:monothiol glutaredoxin
MSKPTIIAYLKPSCGWSNGVRAVLRKYDLPFEDRDIINNPLNRQEMIERSGQMLSPCVEINGHMLADVSGEEVEAWMIAHKLVHPSDRLPEAPIDQPCADEGQGAPVFARDKRRNNDARREEFLRLFVGPDFHVACVFSAAANLSLCAG